MAEEKKQTPTDEVCNTLALREKEFAMALPTQIPSQRFIRVAQTYARLNQSLASLDRTSLYAAFHKCAADGLLPDGREAAIVPFGDKATYMPMIQGICKKARNSGEIKTINAQIVYSNDSYEHWTDELGEHFKHVSARGDRGTPALVYAFCQTRDGGVFFEELRMEDIDAIEKMSRQKSGPWSGPFRTEMMRKSAIRRLLKYRVPSSTDLDDLIRQDDDLYDKETPAKPTEPGQPNRLKSMIGQSIDTTAEPADSEQVPL